MMPEQDNKSHLWIPEQEIANVSKKPTSRPNDYGLNHSVHGNTLSQGLQEIMEFFQRLQSGGSFTDDDLVTFQVVLQDKEDFSAQKKFIEDEGLRINAVKDKHRAVVSAPKDVFGNLQRRVGKYRDNGTKKDFQYIADFEPFRATDKQAASLLRYYQENPQELTIDIQMMLLPEMAPEEQERAQGRIVKKIETQNGHLPCNPYQLTDGTSIIRAMLSIASINEIADDPGVYRVEPTTFFQTVVPSTTFPFVVGPRLAQETDISRLPTVVILDDGVNFPDGLAAACQVHWKASDCTVSASFGNHGTPIASRAVFENLGMHIGDDYLVPRARIIDAQIVDTNSTPADKMLLRIREAVQAFAPVAKIYNLSYNAQVPINGDEMSFLGCELDLLCRKYHICFVVSAGNHQLVFTEDNLRDIIEDDDSRIAEPADAMLAITVGAVVGQTHTGSVSKENDIAPYSRKGPGFCGFYKPDLVAYGATQFKNGITGQDPYALCLSHNGYCALAGTSFTSPTVAGDLAQVLATVPDEDIGLAQALLYNGAISLYDKAAVTQEEIELGGNLYGRGLSSPHNSMFSSENKVSFIHTGTMNRLTKKRVKFHIPSTVANLKVKRGENKVRVTVTCIAQPPVDRTKGSEYSAAYISASIHRINSNGKMIVDNPAVSDNRNKWDTCYHFSNEFSAFDSGSWEVWLELFTRWGVEDDDLIPYSLVITVEDLTEAGNMYSEIIKETAGRFLPVQQTRVSVR
jgi:hypothetical protein